jgi:hypothetical protein
LFCLLWYSSVVLYLCFHSFSFVSIFSSGSLCVCFFFVFRLSVCPLGFLVLCFFFLPSLGMLCFWSSSCWRWRLSVRASLLVILKADFRLRRRTLRVYRLLLLPVGGWRSTLLWLMRNGIMVTPVVSDRQPLCYSCWVTDLPWQWFMDWCSHWLELLPWGEERWSSAGWDVEELATGRKSCDPRWWLNDL